MAGHPGCSRAAQTFALLALLVAFFNPSAASSTFQVNTPGGSSVWQLSMASGLPKVALLGLLASSTLNLQGCGDDEDEGT